MIVIEKTDSYRKDSYWKYYKNSMHHSMVKGVLLWLPWQITIFVKWGKNDKYDMTLYIPAYTISLNDLKHMAGICLVA